MNDWTWNLEIKKNDYGSDMDVQEEYLAHHGVLGMKWGIRRYQNYDGSLTAEGQKHLDRIQNSKTSKRLQAKVEKNKDKYVAKATKFQNSKKAKKMQNRAEKFANSKQGKKISNKATKLVEKEVKRQGYKSIEDAKNKALAKYGKKKCDEMMAATFMQMQMDNLIRQQQMMNQQAMFAMGMR